MKEVWPFILDDTKSPIHEQLFYGFYDSGGICGEIAGYVTKQSAIEDILGEYLPWCSTQDIGTEPEHLGEYGVTVLSGRQYIDRLYYIADNDGEHFSIYGNWSEDKS